MSRPDPDAIETLLSSRRALLERVHDGPVSKPALVEELAISRSTVDRAVRELESASLLRRTGDGLVLTLPGTLALERYRRFRQLLGDLGRSTAVLSSLPADAAFDASVVRDATFVNPELHEPRRPVNQFVAQIRGATRIRLFAAAYIPEAADAFFERTARGDLRAELVVTPDVLDVLVQERAGEIDEAVRAGLTLCRTPVRDAPYCLLLAEHDDRTTVNVVVSGEGAVGGLVQNDSEAAVSWATGRWEQLRDDAEAIVE